MSARSNSNKVQDNTQYSYNHLKTDDYYSIIEQSKRDYERSLNERMQSEIDELGLIRNGYRKPRAFHTSFGTIWLKIPRVLHGNYIPSFLVENSPFDYHLLFAIQSMYLGGMSQRAITNHLNEVYNLDGVTKRQVQTAIQKIIRPSLEFLERDLSETYYPALYVDAHYTPIREGEKVSKKAIMITIGLKSDGSREVLGMDIQTSEAASNYTLFFQKLLDRGLKIPEVIVSDEHKGLRLAIRMNFPLSCWRRCNFHILKTAGMLSGFDSEFVSALSDALLQQSHLSIIHDTFNVLQKYENTYPEAVELIRDSLTDLMNFYPNDAFSELTATNNISESLNSVIRSRTDSVRVFPHSEAYIKLVGNILIERSIKWNNSPSLDGELSQQLEERKDRRLKEIQTSLKDRSFVLNSSITSPCILWVDVIYQDVSIAYVNVSLGVLIVYGCDAVNGKREPVALEFILDNKEEAVKRLIESLKANFNLDDLFLIVAPLSLERYRKLFERNFPETYWQLDISSFIEAVCNIAPKKKREELQGLLKELFKSKIDQQFEERLEQFTDKYSDQFPRAIELFDKYVQQTRTYLDFDLPRSRIIRVDHMSKTLLSKLKKAILDKTSSYLPYPSASDYDKLLKEAFEEEANSSKNKAYINPNRLRKYVK